MNYFKLICLALLLMIKASTMNATPNDVVKDTDVQGVQQSITITGVIVDNDNQPLPGVNVKVKGTSMGTITDINGKYTLAVPSSTSVLLFSYIGYSTIEIVVGSQRSIDVTMEEDLMQIDEVVVVAYGTAKKRDLTGSVGSIDNKVIAQQQLSSVSRALEGAVAGVRISSITGQPGSDARIIVRGMGSVEGSVGTEALIVVDGVPMYNTTTWSIATSNTSFSSINPNDIESITVSKDAASNALYGSRGANGVVFVTTKKGTSGKARVSLETRFGINQQGVPDMDMIKDPKEFYEYAWSTIYNRYRYMTRVDDNGNVVLLDNTNKPNLKNPAISHERAAELASQTLFTNNGAALATGATGNAIGNYSPYRFPQGQYLVGTDGKLHNDAQLLYDNDWNDFFISNRFRQEHNLNIQGGTDKHTYFVSLGYLSDPAYIVRSKFERYSTRAAINSQTTKWLNTSFQMNYSHRMTEFQNNSDNPGSVNTNIFLFKDFFCPMWTLYAYDKDGNIKRDPNTGEALYDMGTGQTESQVGTTGRNTFSGYSPAVYVTKDRRFQGSDDLGIRGEATATFLKDFKATINMSMNNQYVKTNNYGNNVSGTAARDQQGSISQSHGVNMAITTQQLLTWNKYFDKHAVDVMVGHEYMWVHEESTSGSWRMMLIPYFQSTYNATTYTGASAREIRSATEGYFSRVNYNFDQRYLLSASLRRDGTTKFDVNKWGTFWSVGGAWRISEESFMKIPQLNDLKLRASYGVMGNANLNNISPTMTLWSISNTGTVTAPVMGINQGTPANRDLTWETNNQFDVGIDFRLFKRFYGSIDYFNRVTEDMIWNRPLPPSTGVSSRWENIGSMRNYGFEIELGANIINTADFRWSVDANISFLRNELLSIPPGVGMDAYDGGYVSGNYLRGVGKDWYNLYIYRYAGIDPETGLGLLYKKLTQADIDNAPNNAYSGHKAGDIVTTDNISTASWDDPTFFEEGSAIAKAVGGFSTNLAYKNWDLGIICAYQIGGKYYSVNYRNLIGMNLGRGLSKDLQDTWTPDNQSSKLPMRFNGGTDNAGTPLAWFNASYFNIKSVTLGYNLPKALMNSWNMNSVRIYAAVDNALLLSAKKGLDPRNTLGGGDDVGAFSYPQPRYLTLGLNVSF